MTVFKATAFPTPIVTPDTASAFRRQPYISASEYKNAPTAVATDGLVPNGSTALNLSALSEVINRASSWVDLLCFHRSDGTLAASPTTESDWIKVRNNGTIGLICNYKPVIEVDAVALGPSPGNLQSITDPNVINNIAISGKVIWLPAYWWPYSGKLPSFGPVARSSGMVYAIWTYVNGYPHNALATACTAGAPAIVVLPSVPAGAAVSGVYPGTQLTIHDGAATEVIVVSSVSGLTLNLTAPTLYAHTPPAAPDSIRVTAIPYGVEQACISLTSCLIKTRGTRAMQLPQIPGTPPPRQALTQAGGLEDFDIAEKLLAPFKTVVQRS